MWPAMNWKRILKLAASGDPVEVKRSAFDEDSLERLLEDVTPLIGGLPEFWTGREGGKVSVLAEAKTRFPNSSKTRFGVPCIG
jgi:hypothetical protein